MKRIIYFNCLLLGCLLLITPVIPAIQYRTVVDTQKFQFLKDIQSINFEDYTQIITGMSIEDLKKELEPYSPILVHQTMLSTLSQAFNKQYQQPSCLGILFGVGMILFLIFIEALIGVLTNGSPSSGPGFFVSLHYFIFAVFANSISSFLSFLRTLWNSIYYTLFPPEKI